MAANKFLPFAYDPSANIISDGQYAAAAERALGFPGHSVAQSSHINKILRQPTFWAAVLGQFVADWAHTDALDNGDIAAMEANLVAAFQALATQAISSLLQKTGPYTITDTDAAKVLRSNDATSVTWTLSKTATPGSEVEWVQGNAGTIVFSPASGATLVCILTGHNSSAGQYARGSLLCTANTDGNSAIWNLSGVTQIT